MTEPLPYWVIDGALLSLGTGLASLIWKVNSRVNKHEVLIGELATSIKDVKELIDNHEKREDRIFDEMKKNAQAMHDKLDEVRIDVGVIRKIVNGSSSTGK